MNKALLSKILHEQLDHQINCLEQDEKMGVPIGIIDLTLKSVSTNEKEVTTVRGYNTELIETTDGEWLIESTDKESGDYGPDGMPV